MKKVKILGKGIPVFAIVILGLVLISAALLPYFGQITGEAVVNQGLKVDARSWDVPVVHSIGPIYSNVGGTSMSSHNLTNEANEDSNVTLVRTSCARDGGWPHSCPEILTSYWKISTPAPDEVGDVDAVTPSTNDINRVNAWAHFNKLNVGFNSVELEFVSTRAFYSCFEYRTDGDTSQVLTTNGGVNYNTDVLDGLYPYYCQNNNNRTVVIPANEYIEVRMVFGAETDERFDWTKIYVSGSPLIQPITVPANGAVDFFVKHVFPVGTYPGEYSITTTVNLDGYPA